MDMDGTLLDSDHVTVPARNIAALRAAAERGVKLAIASGRTWSLIRGVIEGLWPTHYALEANGAAIRDVEEGRYICRDSIPAAQARRILHILRREDISFEVYCQGQNYVPASDRERVRANGLTRAFAAFFDTVCLFPEDLEQALAQRDVEKFNLFYVPSEKRQAVCQALAAVGPVEISQALEHNLEVNRAGVSKGAALQVLAGRLGLRPDEVMAFGDAGNDLEMLKWAGLSFAMENGTPEAKQAAKRLAPPNREAGVGQMIERFLLNREA